MKNCGKWERHYLAYSEGRLPERKLRRMQGHLAGCLHCQRMLRGLTVLGKLAKAAPLAVARGDLADIVKSRVAEVRAGRFRPLKWRAYETMVLRPFHSPLTPIAATCIVATWTMALLAYFLLTTPELWAPLEQFLSERPTDAAGWAMVVLLIVPFMSVASALVGIAAAPLLLRQVKAT